jgi:hypothetical protein
MPLDLALQDGYSSTGAALIEYGARASSDKLGDSVGPLGSYQRDCGSWQEADGARVGPRRGSPE